MAETLLDRLNRKLAEAFADAWDHRNAIAYEVSSDTRIDPATGCLSGGIKFLVRGGSEWVVVHQERMGELRRDDEVDDFLARGLSQLLMTHPTWPR